jgi:hypothetical protein
MSTDQTKPAAAAPAAKAERKKLPEVKRVFSSLADIDAGKKDAAAKGHTNSLNRYKVTDGKKTVYVLDYSPASAAGRVYQEFGLSIEGLDTGAPFQLSPDKMASKLLEGDTLKKLSEADRKALLDALTKKK